MFNIAAWEASGLTIKALAEAAGEPDSGKRRKSDGDAAKGDADGEDEAGTPAGDRNFSLEDGGVGHGTTRLDDDFEHFPNAPHGGHDALLGNGHDGIDVLANERKITFTERGAQAVGDRGRRRERTTRDWPALLQPLRR